MTNELGRLPVTAEPPRWAVSLLRLFLRADAAETIPGDLIEEYRETIYPARGRRGANWWFVRQIAGFARPIWIFGLAIMALGSGRLAYDTFSPPVLWRTNAAWYARSAFTTWSHATLFLLIGFWSGWRVRRARSGALAALSAHLVGSVLEIFIAAVLFLSVIRRDEAMLDLFNTTGGWGEVWGIPLMLIPFVVVLGSLGALIGKLAVARARPLATR